MKLLLAVVLVGGVLYLAHRAALWAEHRGWIFYSRRKPSSSALGNAFLEVQSLVEPGKRLLLEARQEEDREEDESGEPQEPTGVNPETTDGENA